MRNLVISLNEKCRYWSLDTSTVYTGLNRWDSPLEMPLKIRVWLFNYTKVNDVKPYYFIETVAKTDAQEINHAYQSKQQRQNVKKN